MTVMDKFQENIKKKDKYQCACSLFRIGALSKNNTTSCLFMYQLKELYNQIIQNRLDNKTTNSQDLLKWHDEFLKKNNLKDDYQLKKYLEGKNIQTDKIFEGAFPIEHQLDDPEQWLSNIQIDYVVNNLIIPNDLDKKFQYQGVYVWDCFDPELKDQFEKFSPEYIYQQLQTYNQLGYILNQCHMFSNGVHWVSMCICKTKNPKKICICYYDSQGGGKEKCDPAKQKIETNIERDCTPEQAEKYKHFQNNFSNWLIRMNKYFKTKGISVTLCYNYHDTQRDDFSCGYHALLFLYIISQLQTTNMLDLDNYIKQFSDKNLDDLIKELQQKTLITDEQLEKKQSKIQGH